MGDKNIVKTLTTTTQHNIAYVGFGMKLTLHSPPSQTQHQQYLRNNNNKNKLRLKLCQAQVLLRLRLRLGLQSGLRLGLRLDELRCNLDLTLVIVTTFLEGGWLGGRKIGE